MAGVQISEIKYFKRTCLTLGLLIFQLLFEAQPIWAARGLPGSSEFGFGARLDIWGMETDLAIKAAVAIGLDWIAVDFDWKRHWAQENTSPALGRLDQVVQQAGQHGLSILISIANPPDWARTVAGPDPKETLELLSMLAQRYLQYQIAFELFPAPNTSLGWGAPPNPQAYADLLRLAHQALGDVDPAIALVAGGLSPIDPQGGNSDMDDLEFLASLYRAGAANFMPIIGLRLAALTSEAMAPSGQTDPRVLRHYEAVRQVMVANDHAHGMVWVTCYHWPASISGMSVSNSAEQIRWLNQALHMMKSQLYLGAAFYDRLNPPSDSESVDLADTSLIIEKAGQVYLHPAVKALGRIITMIRTGQNTSFQLFLYKKITLGAEKSLLKKTSYEN